MENEKLIKRASIIDKVLKVIQGFMVAGMIVPAVFIPLTLIFGEKVIASASSLDLGELVLHLKGDFADYLNLAGIKTSIIVMLISAVIFSAVSWYGVKLLRGILVPMKEGRPFDAGISDKIRRLGWVVLIGGGVAEIVRFIAAVFELKAYDLSFLAENPVVGSVSFRYTGSYWFVITALIIFFLSYVFRCGEKLQQEADETL